MTPTYQEHIGQFVVEYLEVMNAQRQAEYRLNGIDPDNNWHLTWSFSSMDNAAEQAKIDQRNHTRFCTEYGCDQWKTFRARDTGAPQVINRQINGIW